MEKLFKFLFALTVVILLPSLQSCEKETTAIYYDAGLTKDLLDFVDMIVAYTDEKGNTQVLTFTKDNPPTNDTQRKELRYWKKLVEYEYNTTGKCTVSFKANGNIINPEKDYYFLALKPDFHIGDFVTVDDVNINIDLTINGGDISLSVTDSNSFSGTAAQEYINNLCQNEYTVICNVDKYGNTTKNIYVNSSLKN